MLVILMCNSSETIVIFLEVILFEIISTGIAKQLSSHWRSIQVIFSAHDLDMLFHWIGAIIKLTAQRTALHFLKSQSQYAIHLASFDGILGKLEGWGASWTIVVYIYNRYTSQAQFIDSSLTTCAITYWIEIFSLRKEVFKSFGAYHKHNQQRLVPLYQK